MKTIWSGFNTKPLTKPDACVVCSGHKGGEFIALNCGHGAPGQGPIHVRCVLDGLETSVHNEKAAQCPTCQKAVDTDTLARLAERVGDGRPVAYPGKDGTAQKEQLVTSTSEQRTLVDALVKAENLRAGRSPNSDFDPSDQEFEDGRYERMRHEAEQFVDRLSVGIHEGKYTSEDIEKGRSQLSQLEDQLRVAAGRAVMHGKGSEIWARDGLEFSEVYDELRLVLNRLSLADLHLHHEEEMVERREDGRAGHPERVWNGFDTEPLTKPHDCVICFGENGGEFMSLDCGHGRPGNDPLHVRCLLDSVSPAAGAGTEAKCPVCSASISEEALSRLADCVARNKDMPFPNEKGEEETTRLFDDSKDQQHDKDEMIRRLVTLQETRAGDDYEPGAEAYDETYEHLTQRVEDLAREVEAAVEERAYTREELEEKLQEVDELENKATIAAGHAAQVPDWESEPSFKEKYQRLLEAREHLENAERRMRQEKEDMERREEEEHGHFHMA